MMNLPNNIYVCKDCMQKSFDAMANGDISVREVASVIASGTSRSLASVFTRYVLPEPIPGVQFLNIGDMEQQIPKKQKIKKKKPKEEKAPLVDIHNLPAQIIQIFSYSSSSLSSVSSASDLCISFVSSV